MHKSKEEIIQELQQSFRLLNEVANAVPRQSFNVAVEDKWTVAENIRHLVTGTKVTAFAFTLPKVVHVLLYGKHSHPSHTYTKVVNNYETKLNNGAKAFGVYVPKKADYDKQRLTQNLEVQSNKLLKAIATKWTDEQLDRYRVKHPILGLLTLRELAYFTLYHNAHHTATIQKYYLS